ncbi:MAG TPA: hypothetical protein VNJ52_10740 [Patescibacteria group bacterium]|nr:hypothetical protein [Patescibacteria group bacterium]
MNKQKQLVRLASFGVLAGVLIAALCLDSAPARAAQTKTGAAQTKTGKVIRDEFFIVSSLNEQKHELLLKLPTEVTMQMLVTGKTSIVDEQGKRLKASDLHSGDTAYITYTQNGAGAQALSIRLGPMTVPELYRRYLNGPAAPALAAAPAPRASAAGHPQPAKAPRGRAHR